MDIRYTTGFEVLYVTVTTAIRYSQHAGCAGWVGAPSKNRLDTKFSTVAWSTRICLVHQALSSCVEFAGYDTTRHIFEIVGGYQRTKPYPPLQVTRHHYTHIVKEEINPISFCR